MIFKMRQKIEALEKVYLDVQEKLSILQDEVSVLRTHLSKVLRDMKKIGVLSDTNSARVSNLELRVTKLETELYRLNVELQTLNEKLSQMRIESETTPKKKTSRKRIKKGDK